MHTKLYKIEPSKPFLLHIFTKLRFQIFNSLDKYYIKNFLQIFTTFY